MNHKKTHPLYLFLPFFFLLAFFHPLAASDFKKELLYIITPLAKEKKMEVEMIFQSGGESYSNIELPISWTGKPFEEIVHLEFFSKNRRLIHDDRHSKDSIVVYHKPYEEIRVKYQVANLDKEENINASFCLDETFLRFMGDCCLITPRWDLYAQRKITLKWKKLPAGWSVANSFGIHETTQELSLSLYSLRLGLFVAGEMEVSRCGCLENAPFVVMKARERFEDKRLIPLLETIVQTQRDFWKDHDFSHFLMVILPTDGKQGLYAEAKLNAFIAFFPPFTKGNEEWKSLTWVLTHEHFHTWNPFKMMPRLSENFNSLAWFTEGFTEYYTALLSYRSKTMDFATTLREVNHFLYFYNTSPFRKTTDERFQKERWKDPQMSLIAYQRGFLLALLWDAKIRKISREKYSLDNVMHDLLQRVKQKRASLSVSDIKAVVGKYLGEAEASKDIQNYIKEGKSIELSNNIFLGNLKIEWFEEAGFNLAETKESEWITGVVEESNAYKAGLRNGQRFKSYSRNKNGVVNVVIYDRYKERKITYYQKNNSLIPRYVMPSRL